MRLGDIRSGLKRGREERRRLLTPGERVFAWSYTVLTSFLVPAGVVLLLSGSGATHSVGIALLVIGLLAMAVPISPFLRAKVRRRRLKAFSGLGALRSVSHARSRRLTRGNCANTS